MSNSSRVQTALDIVTDAFTRIDIDQLPDPGLTWYSSSVAETHPGKKYHLSTWCRRLEKVKHKLDYTRPWSTVADQVCGECSLDNGHGPLASTAHQTARAHRLHAKLVEVANGFDDEHIVAELSNIESMLRTRPHADLVDHVAVWDVALEAYNQLRLLLAGDTAGSEQAQTLRRVAALGLIVNPGPPSSPGMPGDLNNTPYSALDLKLLGAIGTVGRHTATSLRCWNEFRQTVLDGGTLEEARAAAEAKALPLGSPHRLEQLPDTMPVPDGATEVSMADIVTCWRTQATEVAEQVLDEWVDLVNGQLTAHDGLGDLTVVVTPNLRSRYQAVPLSRELDKFGAVFPYQTDEQGVRHLTVPLVVVAWLERFAKHFKLSVELLPAGENTADVVETATRLREAEAGMSLATAIAAARGVVYAQAA